MEKYDYLKAVKEDVANFISNEIDPTKFEDLDALREYLNDELFCNDSVTGNGSGSYTFSTWKAEEKPNKGQTGRSDGKTALHPTVTPLIARKHNTGRFWPLFGRVGAMEATAARRARAKVLRRRAPTFVAGRVRPPPYYAHNEGRMNSFRFYNNFKISKE